MVIDIELESGINHTDSRRRGFSSGTYIGRQCLSPGDEEKSLVLILLVVDVECHCPIASSADSRRLGNGRGANSRFSQC